MAFKLHIGNSTNDLDHLITDINQAFKNASKESERLFGHHNADVFVINELYYVIPEYGFGGFTTSDRTIYININKSKKTLDINLLTSLIMHEMSHAYRWSAVGYGETLGEALVTEGIGCYIESLYLGHCPIYSSIKLKDKYINLAIKELNSSNYVDGWFFGDDKFDRWVGYTLGFKIVEKYFNHNNHKKSDIVNIDAKKILDYYFK